MKTDSRESISDKDSVTDQGIQNDSNDSDDSPSYNELLIQTILLRATTPSPLKACYTLQEMELAALNLSQVLASHVHSETGTSSKRHNQATMIHGTPIYNEGLLLSDNDFKVLCYTSPLYVNRLYIYVNTSIIKERSLASFLAFSILFKIKQNRG